MSQLTRKVAAYGVVAMLAAAIAWLWVWGTEKHIERSVTQRHHTDRWGM